MQRPSLSLEDVLDLAIKAKDYARSQIVAGGTQLENNELPLSQFKSIDKAVVEDTRKLVSYRTLNQIKYHPLENDYYLLSFENQIEVTSKYSIGNCNEFAFQALDYVLLNTDNVRAEIYSIEGGDHNFLVLNRRVDSNVSDPSTWGDKAVICDPWINKVYPASEYLVELKSFSRKKNKNTLVDFNPKKHKLILLSNYNTDYIRENRSVKKLKNSFDTEVSYMLKGLEDYRDGLEKERKNLFSKYGEEDVKVHILTEKINEINQYIHALPPEALSFMEAISDDDYRKARKELHAYFIKILDQVMEIAAFSEEEKAVLFSYGPSCAGVDWLRFFGIKNATESKLTKYMHDYIHPMNIKK